MRAEPFRFPMRDARAIAVVTVVVTVSMLVLALAQPASGKKPVGPHGADHTYPYLDFDSSSLLAFDGGYVYSVSKRTSREARVVRQTRRGRTRELVATLRTASRTILTSLKVRAGQVAVAGLLLPSDRRSGRDLPVREFIAVAHDGRLEMTYLTTLPHPAGVCDESASLVDVRPDRSTVVSFDRYTGLASRCQVRRLEREIKSFAPDGGITLLAQQTGPWGASGGLDEFEGDLLLEDGFYEVEFAPQPSSGVFAARLDLLFTSHVGGELQVERISDHRTARLPYDLNRRFWEIADDGRIFSSRFGRHVPHTTLFADPFDMRVGKPLNRDGMISYFHLCDDKLVEIARRGRKIYRERNRRWWRVSVRDLDGNWLRTLPGKLRRGTNFMGCDAKVARFASPTGGKPVFDLEAPAT